MYTECLHFFAVPGTTIQPQVLRFGLFLLFIGSNAGMNGRPSENSFHRTFFTMYKYSRGRRCLMIDTTISFQIDQAFGIDIVDKPANLISMRLNDYLKFMIGVKDTHGSSIRIHISSVHIRFDVL